ncbi:PEP-CTERM -sorting domain protein [Methyloversatilis sp. RAC08]|uniref:Hcp family type VI secretion system effector n=1 Tax=Methyloversatilis sp. RAC08 TaxID=1842540 RepID=UPI00083CD5F9|nr:type VI secretion system tube protein Hcp [Methyloversatilis sp. RAC08]AOF80576.1 PEP-CTERM -sorting domain protein [Methyloversatilis sp. RAC08]
MKRRLAASWIAASTLCLTGAPALAADYYLQIPGIDGGSVAEDFKDQIEVSSFSWNVFNTVPTDSTGGTASKAVFGDLHWTQAVNQSIPTLFAGVVGGKAFDEVVLSFVKAGEDKSYRYFTMTFDDVTLTSLSLSGTSGGDEPQASLSLSYTRIALAYIPQDKGGKLGDPITAIWDLAGVKGDARVLMQLASPDTPILLDVSQPIPEPEQAALLLAGLGLIGWVTRRRRLC